ncbi:MAG: GNAT family N-acetyltransferase [Bacteroidales bacterium]|nr:GNAT family N-acetyltransferase [Bacteroidales bacterium]MBN2817430.1 GNAT family N-acetyltransferase [Bacteroidales bacterium]
MSYTIKPLTSELLEDYLWFFDNRAFCDNPEWAGCFCTFYMIKASAGEWMKRTPEMNRNRVIELIKSGKQGGFLAYNGNTPIAYCNANAKENLCFDKFRTEINDTGTERIYSVVCFVIDPEYRRKGISKAFLKHIIINVDWEKYNCIEAYPSINTLDIKSNYHGFEHVYKELYFEEYRIYKEHAVLRYNKK